MRTRDLFLTLSGVCIVSTLLFTSCETDNELSAPSVASEVDIRTNPNSVVYPPTANMFGKSYGEWTAEWWKWMMSADCDSNPLLDQTGEDAYAGQSGPVFFLAGTAGGSATRDITVSRDKALLFPIVNAICDYPCPEDFGFEPGPGQTVEELLQECATGYADIMDGLTVTLDGVELNNESDYRFQSPQFFFTGDPDIVNCLDPCVTGEEQPAVSEGYWMMIKKNELSVGEHVLHFSGGISMYNFSVDVTYNITIE